jgi:hypothetical protein
MLEGWRVFKRPFRLLLQEPGETKAQEDKGNSQDSSRE